MSRFLRKESPASFEHYEKYRPFLRRDFRFACAYCERPEAALGGEEFYEIDHFRPAKRFPELTTHYSNLYYACAKCNRHKGSTWPPENLTEQGFRFADPCQEDMYVAHLEEGPDGQLRALTNTGTYTCDHIGLNRQALLVWRRDRRGIADDLLVLQSLGRDLALLLQTAPESALQDELHRKLAALNSTMMLLRQRYSL